MSDIEVRAFEPSDDGLLRAWWEVGHAAEAERPYDFWSPWDEAKVLWTLPPIDRDVHFLGAFVDGEMVGAGRLVLPLKDNEHLGFVEVYVRPDRRRQGVGRALVGACEAIGAQHGRTSYLGDTFVAPGRESPGTAFAAALGYPRVALEVVKIADLGATESTWPALADEAAAALGEHDLVWWVGPTPAEHVPGICELFTRFLGEIPMEDMTIEPQTWDEDRLRRVEERRVRAGFTTLLVAARAADGTLVGYSNCSIGELTGHRAGIDGTLVLPEHRGHRLGLAMKVRLHQLVRAEFPDCRIMWTGNAGVNDHMNAVNERLGYTVLEDAVGVQKTL